MFCRLAKPNDIRTILRKSFSISSQVKNNHHHPHHQHPVHHPPHKVTVLGAGGAVSQPLSLLLKTSSKVGKLCLYDVDHTPGVAADLSHIDTKTVVTGYLGTEQLEPCLTKSDVVLITAGIPRKPGMTEDEQFNTNAGIVKDLVSAIGDFCPKAMICIITNPECSVTKLVVPVVGGNSGITIVPLISQTIPPVDLSQEERKKITQKLQNADTEIMETKAGTGSATLSMAHAASKFTLSLLAAIDGEEGRVESAYVKSEETTAAYLSTPLLLGDEGIVKNLGLSNLDEFETELVKAAISELTRNIQKGIDYANKS
ncbi:MDH2 [Mytilus coruscus]|uniref:Malate dehydrogenase, mitochondrial n=1 Tax=Mytilus coruscus TaxID=42192 RepID=A0A6J8AQ91_MYTCO|nr:MDH2 [Mytilus coruscus]